MFLWKECARGFPRLLQELGSYQFYSCLDSIVFRHAFDESTRRDFAWVTDIAWIPVWLSILCRMRGWVCLFGKEYWYVGFRGPSSTRDHQESIFCFELLLIVSWWHTRPIHADCRRTMSPRSGHNDRGWEWTGLLHVTYLLWNEWCPAKSVESTLDQPEEWEYDP